MANCNSFTLGKSIYLPIESMIKKIQEEYYYDVIIEEMGVVLKNLDRHQIKCIQEAQNTEYIKPLIEMIKNNPKFDLVTFVEKMNLEDISTENPSKILLSAQGTKYHEETHDVEDLKEEIYENISRIVTKEQADIIKQCVEKNEYYNFMGATDKNHGFDVETFGLNFISQLDYGLDQYTYEAINKNPELIEQIKNNSKVAQYVAQAVNEHIKRRRTIEAKVQDRERDYYSRMEEYEFAPDYEKEQILKAKQEDRKKDIFNRKYNTYEEDIHDVETLYMERMKDLKNMYEKGNIEMFKAIEFDDLDFGGYCWNTDFQKDIIKLETLKESDAMEYLKNSRREKIEVVETDKAFIKRALKTTNDLVIKQDNQGKDITYLQSMLQQRIEGPTNAGSSYENVTEKELLENLLNADWEETSHPDVMEGCRVFKCNLPGLEGILDLDKLGENA